MHILLLQQNHDQYYIKLFELMQGGSGTFFLIVLPIMFFLSIVACIYLQITLKRSMKGKCSRFEGILCTALTSGAIISFSIAIIAFAFIYEACRTVMSIDWNFE